jgi:hypothetical protein
MLPKTCPACKQKALAYDPTLVYCTSCPIYRKRLNFIMRVLVWATTKKGWWWRLALAGWFGVMLVQNWHNPGFALARTSNPFSALDMGIHELGHVIFAPFGEFMHIAGGSLFQCIFPLLWLIGFLQVRYYFAAALCWCWLGLNFFDVATYAGDAQARLLPLAGGLDSIGAADSETAYDQGHDWYQLLSRTGHLQADQAIAHFLRIAGTAVFVLGLVIGLVLITYMVAGSINRVADRRAKAANQTPANGAPQ